MSKTWGKIGAWAADSEAAEAEELAAAPATFPSLRDSLAAAPKQKKKANKMTLQEFNTSSAAGLTPAEMIRLPTGPKERSPDEILHGGGRGFSGYGGRDRDGDSSWGGGGGRRPYGGGFENDDRRSSGPSRVSDSENMPNLPSRADEADNWAMGKKNLPAFDSGRGNKYSSLGSGGGGGGGAGGGYGGSRADDVDNWGSGKRAAPTPGPVRSTFGSGFREPGFREPGPERFERTKLVLDPPKKNPGPGPGPVPEPKANKPSPFGAARPREEVLAEKGLDWKQMEMDIEVKKNISSRPTSSQSSRPNSRPNSSQSNRSEGVGLDGMVKVRPKVNPFGDAKPREVLLEEKGLDWRKIDLDLDNRRVERPGSGSGRVSGPHSQSESFDEPRNVEFIERPGSRGNGDMWNRQSDERRAFQGGTERGFIGNRGMDRPRSRERW